MDNYKKFIPCIYLKEGKAVAGFQDQTVYDLSTDDASHEAALDVIKEICSKAQIPVIGAGNVKRMEDVKKLLYAGCMKAALNYSKEGNIEITREVSLKFGKDKIVACIAKASEIETNKAVLEELVCDRRPHSYRQPSALPWSYNPGPQPEPVRQNSFSALPISPWVQRYGPQSGFRHKDP